MFIETESPEGNDDFDLKELVDLIWKWGWVCGTSIQLKNALEKSRVELSSFRKMLSELDRPFARHLWNTQFFEPNRDFLISWFANVHNDHYAGMSWDRERFSVEGVRMSRYGSAWAIEFSGSPQDWYDLKKEFRKHAKRKA